MNFEEFANYIFQTENQLRLIFHNVDADRQGKTKIDAVRFSSASIDRSSFQENLITNNWFDISAKLTLNSNPKKRNIWSKSLLKLKAERTWNLEFLLLRMDKDRSLEISFDEWRSFFINDPTMIDAIINDPSEMLRYWRDAIVCFLRCFFFKGKFNFEWIFSFHSTSILEKRLTAQGRRLRIKTSYGGRP